MISIDLDRPAASDKLPQDSAYIEFLRDDGDGEHPSSTRKRESVCVEETMDNYAFALNAAFDLEPLLKMEMLKI